MIINRAIPVNGTQPPEVPFPGPLSGVSQPLAGLNIPKPVYIIFGLALLGVYLYSLALNFAKLNTRAQLAATVNTLLSVQKSLTEHKSIPGDKRQEFKRRYMKIRNSINRSSLRWYDLVGRLRRAGASVRDNWLAQRLLEDVKLSAMMSGFPPDVTMDPMMTHRHATPGDAHHTISLRSPVAKTAPRFGDQDTPTLEMPDLGYNIAERMSE